jgi:poly-beta-hydroxyalkanoate depolymerase
MGKRRWDTMGQQVSTLEDCFGTYAVKARRSLLNANAELEPVPTDDRETLVKAPISNRNSPRALASLVMRLSRGRNSPLFITCGGT